MSRRFAPFTLVQSTNARVQSGDTPIEQQLADAFNANNAIMAYVQGIGSTSLPALHNEPVWYRDFKSRFVETKVHAMKWINVIAPHLVSIPSGIVGFTYTWNIEMHIIDSALGQLVRDPNDRAAQEALRNGLTKLIDGLRVAQKSVVDFAADIRTFDDDLRADAVVLQKAADQSKQSAGYNQHQVQALTSAVEQLKKEIKTWNAVIAAGGIGAGISFWLGAVLAVFTGGISLAFGVVGLAAGIVTAVLADQKVKSLTGEVRAAQEKMDSLNREIGELQILMSSLNELVALASAAGDQMKLIIAAWDTLEVDLQGVITDLDNAKGDLSPLDLPGLQNELRAATADWAELSEFCKVIAGIQYAPADPKSGNLPAESAEAAA